MTHNAREVLNDCRLALQMLEDETDLQKWRIVWAAAVALIRAVGHVLDKVDGSDKDIKEISKTLFKEWNSDAPEHLIFRDFIDQERNNLLKEYRSNVHPFESVKVLFTTTLVPVSGGEPVQEATVCGLDENIYRPMLDGTWEGDDARDVLMHAINWWGDQLNKVDQLTKIAKKSP
ncbi:MAG: hypothetical protein EPN97_17215 [Alphaproteobacteria bacterium]|nr:MAG: hypothetical protein EPN97_17215 [Alphaproteobacteria bacterium]